MHQQIRTPHYAGHVVALPSGYFRAMVRWDRTRLYTKQYPTLQEAEAARVAMLAMAAEHAPGGRPPPTRDKSHWDAVLAKARADGIDTTSLSAEPHGLRVKFRVNGTYHQAGLFKDLLGALIYRNLMRVELGLRPL